MSAGAPRFIEHLPGLGKNGVFATNNSSRHFRNAARVTVSAKLKWVFQNRFFPFGEFEWSDCINWIATAKLEWLNNKVFLFFFFFFPLSYSPAPYYDSKHNFGNWLGQSGSSHSNSVSPFLPGTQLHSAQRTAIGSDNPLHFNKIYSSTLCLQGRPTQCRPWK